MGKTIDEQIMDLFEGFFAQTKHEVDAAWLLFNLVWDAGLFHKDKEMIDGMKYILENCKEAPDQAKYGKELTDRLVDIEYDKILKEDPGAFKQPRLMTGITKALHEKALKRMTINEIVEEFERLIKNGEIEFEECKLKDLPTDWCKRLVKGYIEEHNITWRLGNKTVGNANCIQIDDLFIRYLDVINDTEQFIFCKDGHRESVHPNEVTTYLINEYELNRMAEV